MRRGLLLAGVALSCVASAAPAIAAPDEVASDVADEVMSPFCPGLTLHDCPSDAAMQLRERIARWAEQGETKPEILDRLEAEFGPTIRAVPPGRGSGLLAWLLPALALLAGAASAIYLARRWTRSRRATEPTSEDVMATPGERERLRRELQRIRNAT